MPNPLPDNDAQIAPLAALLEQAGVVKSSVIRTVGPGALVALLWFCRHGYDQAGCVCAGEAALHEEPDAVLVAQPCSELELKRLLAVARQVRPGGAFIFQLRSGPEASLAAVDWMLRHAGFTIERRLDGRRRTRIVARRSALALGEAA